MSQPSESKPPAPKLVICDSNVVMLMTTFCQTKMFDSKYSFGELEVHVSVIDELERWITRRGAKFTKFGQGLIEDALRYSRQHTGKLKELSDGERTKSHKTLAAMESRISPESKGADTSTTDKDLLTLAWKNKARLATQERTMRSLALRSLGKDALLSFEEMVVDLHKAGVLSTKEVKDGLDNLARFNESLRTDGKKLIDDQLREKEKIPKPS